MLRNTCTNINAQQKASFPIGVNSFTDIVDYLQRAGVQVEISGHEGMPDMSMEVSKPNDIDPISLMKRMLKN